MMNEKQNDPTRAADSRGDGPTPEELGGLNANLDKSHALRDMIQVQPEESFYDVRVDEGWPGDGSGMDDLADFNQMEGYDL